jgi:DNA-binding beta-propeller fold protein YncE
VADTTGCGTPATAKVGDGPAGIAVDPATDTVYVTNSGPGMDGSGHTVSVINGATCNAGNTSGCSQTPATVHVGHFAFGAAFDAANETVYVTDAIDDTVSMIDARTCHAGDISGCSRTPPTAAAGAFPIAVAVDPDTNTVYIADNGKPVVSVINGAACNAMKTTGCRPAPVTLKAQGGPDGLAMNEATDALFVANNGVGSSTARANTVSVVNAATCNAEQTSGCDQDAPVALTGSNPGGNTVDEQTNTLYVTTFDNTLQVINGVACTAVPRTVPQNHVLRLGVSDPDPVVMGASPFASNATFPRAESATLARPSLRTARRVDDPATANGIQASEWCCLARVCHRSRPGPGRHDPRSRVVRALSQPGRGRHPHIYGALP